MAESKSSDANSCLPNNLPLWAKGDRCVRCRNKKKCNIHATLKIKKRNSPGKACPLHKKQKKKCRNVDTCTLWHSKPFSDNISADIKHHKWDPAVPVIPETQTSQGLNHDPLKSPTPSPQLFTNTLFTNSIGPIINAATSTLYTNPPPYDPLELLDWPFLPIESIVPSLLPKIIMIDSNTQIDIPAYTGFTQLADIQFIFMQLLFQDASKASNLPYSIQLTPLQQVIPHDPRIDLLPSEYMRDYMIIFHDCFDIDECLHLFINEARFHGGDPADPMNWELPEKFFSDYQFIVTMSDLVNTNKWRKLRDEKEFEMGPFEESYTRFGGELILQ